MGFPAVDDQQIVSAIIYCIKHDLRWKDEPKSCGKHKTLCSRFIRWSLMGLFDRIFAGLAEKN